MSEYKGLKYLVGCYFHQDVIPISGSAENALDEFKEAESEKIVKEAADDIAIILDDMVEEELLRKKLLKFGIGYAPWLSDEMDARDWLNKIMVNLYEHLYP